MKNRLMKSRYISVLDIGTGKICCLIAKVSADGKLCIVGNGCSQSQGIACGKIIDVGRAVGCIKDAIVEAEKSANKPRLVDSVYVNLSSLKMESIYTDAQITVPDAHFISTADIRKVVDMAVSKVDLKEKEIIHQIPTSYIVDGQKSDNPVGLSAKNLGVQLHLVVAPLTEIRTLSNVLERCQVWIKRIVATPFASGLSALTDCEREEGATIIDIGSGVSSIGIFSRGFLHYVESIPVGGNLITKDLACVLKTPLSNAEAIKTLEGASFISPRDSDAMVQLPVIGEEEELATLSVSKERIKSIMIARINQIFEIIKMQLLAYNTEDLATKRIVLSGGFAHMTGIRDTAAEKLESLVRLGKPINISGLNNYLIPMATTTSIGLLIYATKYDKRDEKQFSRSANNWFMRVIQWIIQNF